MDKSIDCFLNASPKEPLEQYGHMALREPQYLSDPEYVEDVMRAMWVACRDHHVTVQMTEAEVRASIVKIPVDKEDPTFIPCFKTPEWTEEDGKSDDQSKDICSDVGLSYAFLTYCPLNTIPWARVSPSYLENQKRKPNRHERRKGYKRGNK